MTRLIPQDFGLFLSSFPFHAWGINPGSISGLGVFAFYIREDEQTARSAVIAT